MACDEHTHLIGKMDSIENKQDTMGEDLAVIKSALIGNGRKGMFAKVEQHEQYFQMAAGAFFLLSISFAVAKLLLIA